MGVNIQKQGSDKQGRPLAVLLTRTRRSLTEAIEALGRWRVTAFAESPTTPSRC